VSVARSHANDIQFVFVSCCLYECACLAYVICVCLRMVVSNTYCAVFLFDFLRLVYPLLLVSLDYHFLIATSVFSSVYLQCANTVKFIKVVTILLTNPIDKRNVCPN
jgi:hypothetical protein